MDRFVAAITLQTRLDPLRRSKVRNALKSHAFLFGLAALSIPTFGLIVALIGPSTIMAPWDVLVYLDAGWRIVSGQAPHVDFYTPVGPLVYWLTAVGMHFAGPSLEGYVYGNLIFLAVVAPWGMVVLFKKVTPIVAFLLTIVIVVLIVAPRPLGYDPSITSYAMVYNRYGWVLTSILFVQLFSQNQRPSDRATLFDCVSSGLLIGLIFFCKISFFAFAVAGVALASVVRPELRSRVWLVPTAFLVVCLTVWIGMDISPGAYLRDVLLAGKSQSMDIRVGMMNASLRGNIVQFFLLAVVWTVLVGLPVLRGTLPIRISIKATIVWTFIVLSAFGITIGNAGEGNDVPLFLIAVIWLFNETNKYMTQRVSTKMQEGSPYKTIVIAGVAAFLATTTVKDIRSLIIYIDSKDYNHSSDASYQRIDAPWLRDFLIPYDSDWDTAYARAGDVPARINEGLSVLRGKVPSDARLMTLAFTDPFSFALQRQPPKKTPLFWDLGISFDRLNHPTPDELLAEVDFVIYPSSGIEKEGCCWETMSALLDIYGGYLDTNFVEAVRSSHWVLLKRSSDSASLGSREVTEERLSAVASRSQEGGGAAFPLAVEADGRYLQDSRGRPFLVKGDTAWSLIAELRRKEASSYLRDRRERGFNTILVNLIEHTFATHAPANAYGAQPFIEAGRFDMPNEEYFAHADWIVHRALEEGFLVLLAPTYVGFDAGEEGWYHEMTLNGAARLGEFGRYLGRRYREYPNIIWVQNGDHNPADRELVRAVAEGIRETNPGALQTAHNAPGTAGADYWPHEAWLEVNNVYSYDPIFPEAKAQYLRSPALPFILIESHYELGVTSDTQRLRGQAYAALLTGAAGHVFGNSPIWYFDGTERYSNVPSGWHEALDSRGAQSMTHLHRLFDGLPWTALQPDVENDFLMEGVGSGYARAVAAMTSDGSLGIAYLPDGRAVSMNMALLRSRNVRAKWYDPTTGEVIEARESTNPSPDIQTFVPPPANHFGDDDWVLLLSAE